MLSRALLPKELAAAGRHNPEGTEWDDQNRALWIMHPICVLALLGVLVIRA